MKRKFLFIYLIFLILQESSIKPQPPSLNNFGVSCYFNAVIQALNATRPLVDILPELKYYDDFPKKFINLLLAIQNRKNNTAPLKEFYEEIVKKIARLNGIVLTTRLEDNVKSVIQQEDASEFLILLLNELTMGNKSTINEIFSYQENLYFRKPDEETPFRNRMEQPTNLLSIPVYEEIKIKSEETGLIETIRFTLPSIQESFKEYFQEEEQDIFDAKTQLNKPTFLKRHITTMSKVFILHLKRFYYDLKLNKQKKYKSSIDIPLLLNMQEFADQNVTLPTYELYAAVNHQGEQASSGHYVAYIKYKDQWYSCNDTQIKPIASYGNIREIINKDGYILFYQQIEETPTLVEEKSQEKPDEEPEELKKKPKQPLTPEQPKLDLIKKLEEFQTKERERKEKELLKIKKEREESEEIEKALKKALEDQREAQEKKEEERARTAKRQQDLQREMERLEQERTAERQRLRELQAEDRRKKEQQRNDEQLRENLRIQEERLRKEKERREILQKEEQRAREVTIKKPVVLKPPVNLGALKANLEQVKKGLENILKLLKK